MQLTLTRSSMTTFAPADEDTLDRIKRFAVGATITADVKLMRHPEFHRKGMLLFRTAWGMWQEQAGRKRRAGANIPEMDFDNFRKKVTVRAGFHKTLFNFDGTFEFEAESLAFGEMEQDRFEAVIDCVIDVLLGEVLDGCDVEDLMRIIRFG